jgi:hypothetical protein
MHQTGASSNVETWKAEVIPLVQHWLEYSMFPNNSAPMAYFFWDDKGIDLFMNKYEKDFVHDFNDVFTPVERADIFRVLVCQKFGGVVCIPSQEFTTPLFLFTVLPNPRVVCRHRHRASTTPRGLDRPVGSLSMD